VAAKRRKGHEGRAVVWPWADRGRAKVTPDSVQRNLEALRKRADMWAALVAGLVRL
jgi:hypothetical protein